MGAERPRLIADWRRGWRFWSVRLEALAVLSGTLLLGLPDAALQIWMAAPDLVRTLLPPRVTHWLPPLLGLAALVARFLRQKGLDDD